MEFNHHFCGWVRVERRREHPLESMLVGESSRNGGVAVHLVKDKYARALPRTETEFLLSALRPGVVFRQLQPPKGVYSAERSARQFGGEPAPIGDERREIGAGVGPVVNPGPVHNDSHRGLRGTGLHRSQRPVLERNVGGARRPR